MSSLCISLSHSVLECQWKTSVRSSRRVLHLDQNASGSECALALLPSAHSVSLCLFSPSSLAHSKTCWNSFRARLYESLSISIFFILASSLFSLLLALTVYQNQSLLPCELSFHLLAFIKANIVFSYLAYHQRGERFILSIYLFFYDSGTQPWKLALWFFILGPWSPSGSRALKALQLAERALHVNPQQCWQSSRFKSLFNWLGFSWAGGHLAWAVAATSFMEGGRNFSVARTKCPRPDSSHRIKSKTWHYPSCWPPSGKDLPLCPSMVEAYSKPQRTHFVEDVPTTAHWPMSRFIHSLTTQSTLQRSHISNTISTHLWD